MKLLKLLPVIPVSCLTLITYNALAIDFPFQNSDVKFQVNGRLTLDYTTSSDDDFHPDFDRYKQSLLVTTLSKPIGNAIAGATAAFTVNKDFSQSYASGYLSKGYLFLQSNNLGQTHIGKTSSVLVDYFLKAQNYDKSITNVLPQTKEVNTFWTWKYSSSKNSYYDYSISFNHKAKTSYGKTSHGALNINWHFNPAENHKIDITSLYSQQSYYRDFSSPLLAGALGANGNEAQLKNTVKMGALGLAYQYDKLLRIDATGYFGRETLDIAKENKPKNHIYGGVFSLVLSPVKGLNLVSSYSLHELKNKADNFNLSFDETLLAKGEKITTKTLSVGINYIYNDRYKVYSEYSKTQVKSNLNELVTKTSFITSGLAFLF